MRKPALVCMAISTFITVMLLHNSAEAKQGGTDTITIRSIQADLTGNGKKDSILLQGRGTDKEHPYMEKVWADLHFAEGKRTYLPMNPGIRPDMVTADLTGDGIPEVLQFSESGDNGGSADYSLYTFKNGIPKEITLPGFAAEGYFENHYQAVLSLPYLQKPIQIDLLSRRDIYRELGLYQKNGLLNEPAELMMGTQRKYKIIENGKEAKLLVSIIHVNGFSYTDHLGTLKTTWKFAKGGWRATEVRWNGKIQPLRHS